MALLCMSVWPKTAVQSNQKLWSVYVIILLESIEEDCPFVEDI